MYGGFGRGNEAIVADRWRKWRVLIAIPLYLRAWIEVVHTGVILCTVFSSPDLLGYGDGVDI